MFNIQTRDDANLLTRPEQKQSDTKHVLILGLGNILLGDEGIGVHIAQRLQEEALPDNVKVIDGGTASLDVLLQEHDIEKLLVIDALRAGNEPGTIYRANFRAENRDKLKETLTGQDSISLHQIGFIEALTIAEKTGCEPEEIVIIGVEPKCVDYSLELTDEVKKNIPKVIDLVLKEIKYVIHAK